MRIVSNVADRARGTPFPPINAACFRKWTRWLIPIARKYEENRALPSTGIEVESCACIVKAP
jgi:hypothetical protein